MFLHVGPRPLVRMNGITALNLWDLVIEVLHTSAKGRWAQEDLVRKECETHPKGRTNNISHV